MSNTLSHPFDDQRYMGTVTQVGPSSVRVNLPNAGCVSGTLHHGNRIASGEVGEFVVIECDEIAIFGRVLDVRLPERERLTVEPSLGARDHVHPVGTIQLLASIDLSQMQASPGITRYPRLGCRVYASHPHLLRWLISGGGRQSASPHDVTLSLASFASDHTVDLSVTPEQLFGRHCAVLGTTGGGKSWTVAKTLEEAIKHKAKVILLDATGEYRKLEGEAISHITLGEGECLPDSATEVSFPHSDLIEGDLFALFRPSGQSQGPKLRAAFRSLRLVEKQPELAAENGTLIKRMQERKPIESAYVKYADYVESHGSAFNAKVLPKQVREECVWPYDRNDDDFYGDYSNEEGYCLTLMMRIESIVTSAEYGCMFNTNDIPTVVQKIEEFVDDQDSKLLRVSMQNVPFGNYAREVVANAIGRHLLEKARLGIFKSEPLVLFLDEAHQFVNRTIGDEHLRIELDAFSLIAKEGRKYGLSICIATQRPRDIPQDVLSQMGTLVVHRLTNDQDRHVVEQAAGEIDSSAAAFLPTLGPGEAVIIGVDIPVPMAIQVRSPKAKPDSQGPDYQAHWSYPITVSSADAPIPSLGISGLEAFGVSEYELPEGQWSEGETCELHLDDGRFVVVGYMAVVELAQRRWEVLSIDADMETITLRRV